MERFKNLSDFFNPFIKINDDTEEFYFDLHLHTKDSDGSILPEKLEKFLKNKSYLVSITDHNEISGCEKLENLGIKTVPGIELGCNDGFELLVYFRNFEDCKNFFKEHVEPYRDKNRMARTSKDIFYFLEALKNYDVHTSIPHIKGLAQKNFLENKSYINSVINAADSIEVHNHSLPAKNNLIAAHTRKVYNKSETLGSDAHTMREVKSYFYFINHHNKKMRTFFDNLHKVRVITGIGYHHLKYLLKKN